MEHNFNRAETWVKIRRVLLNKYLITGLVFAVLIGFGGEHSLYHYLTRQREVRELREQRDAYKSQTEETNRRIRTMQSTDSLEKYAREHYYMHAVNEDIYLIDE